MSVFLQLFEFVRSCEGVLCGSNHNDGAGECAEVGGQLHSAYFHFLQHFLPHMKHEEQEFQVKHLELYVLLTCTFFHGFCSRHYNILKNLCKLMIIADLLFNFCILNVKSEKVEVCLTTFNFGWRLDCKCSINEETPGRSRVLRIC